jgi:hypothetical protein
MKLKAIIQRVEQWLEEKPDLRDSDEKLVSNIWYDDLRLKNIKTREGSYLHFLSLYGTGQLTSADSITRARRKVQEDNPHLRGENYEKRQKELQEETQRELFS